MELHPYGSRTLLPPSYMDHYPERWAGGFKILLAQPGLESAPSTLLFLNKHGAAAGLCVSPAFHTAPRAVSHCLLPTLGRRAQPGRANPAPSCSVLPRLSHDQDATRATQRLLKFRAAVVLGLGNSFHSRSWERGVRRHEEMYL